MAWYILKKSTWIRLHWPYHAFCVPIVNTYYLISKCRKLFDCLLFIQGLIHNTKTDRQHIYEINVLIHTKKNHLLNYMVRFGVQKIKHHICIDTKKSCFSSLRSWSFSIKFVKCLFFTKQGDSFYTYGDLTKGCSCEDSYNVCQTFFFWRR